MNIVSTHAIQEVRILIDDVLVIKEEFVRLEQLLLFYIQHVLFNIVAHNVIVFHVIVRNCLATKHY